MDGPREEAGWSGLEWSEPDDHWRIDHQHIMYFPAEMFRFLSTRCFQALQGKRTGFLYGHTMTTFSNFK